MSTVLPNVLSASSIVGTLTGTLGSYPSTLFNKYAGPLSDVSDQLSFITGVINGNPSGPLSNIAGDLGGVSADMAGLDVGYSADAAVVTDDPTLSSGVETVTVTGTTLEWGITKDGTSVIKGDNFVSLEYKQDWVIADYQIEGGGFESYDKVALPFDIRVAVSCGGAVDKREAFVNSIKAIAGDLNLYDVVTPEQTLQSVNIAHVDTKRTSTQGVGLIVVYIYLLEIRVTAEVAFADAAATPASPSNTKSPAGAATKNDGTVQAIPALPTQQSLISSATKALGF